MDNLTAFFTTTISLDFETTSPDPTLAKITELGVAYWHGDNWATTTQLVNPGVPIPPESSALTYITDKTVANSPPINEVAGSWTDLLKEFEWVISHNYQYEKAICETELDLTIRKWICTLRLARHAYSSDETFLNCQLSYLRFRLNVDVDDSLISHRAGTDALIAAKVLEKLIQVFVDRGDLDLDGDIGQQLADIQARPIIVDTMPFGKHKGKPMLEIPIDYWKWALSNMDSLNSDHENYDADFAASVEAALSKKLGIED